ncbi:hypothetical protein DMN91_001228 [Ooceraea biroi]|uniref:Uncharacterized protein n=1 Tax=Ooceraea biroi TaxID=2015173 RepID=A0A3L8E419_OOCBI|nr:hypothetical protein DMN91_001228 [Ooceraea biroi]
MIARLPTVTHSTVWRIPVSDYEPLPRVLVLSPIFDDRETAHGTHSTFGAFQSRITNHYHEFGPVTDHLMIARLSHADALLAHFRLDYELLPRSQTTNHYHEFGPVHRSFNDRETAHGDAFNGLAHSSLGLRTITTSLVLFTDHLMIARLSMPMRFGAFRLGLRTITTSLVLSTDLLMIARLPMVTHSTVGVFQSQTTNHYHEFGPVHRLLMIARLPTETHSTVWRIPVSDYEPLPRVWSCPPTFNDPRLPTVTHSTVWRIPVSDYEPLPRVWSCPPIF